MIDLYFYTRPINWVDMSKLNELGKKEYPFIVLFYPVLREDGETMHTTFKTLAKLDYPKNKHRIIAIPNSDDLETIKKLQTLQKTFTFLEIMEVPPTTDPSWQVVWKEWDANKKAYWWHVGKRAKNRNLPPKKTRQLIYAFYRVAAKRKSDFLVNYIDADTCLPPDHFLAGAVGIQQYDVLQATNIAANFNDSWFASFHSFDHMVWDGLKYPHLSANGRHPYWFLGKSLYLKASDLIALGGFHPWITIEDPELGMRFWKNGKRLGIIEKPVIEEVPNTMIKGFLQRKRWICGFFQSLSEPLRRLKMTPFERLLSWMNFFPCLNFWINSIGIPTGIWALWQMVSGKNIFPLWVIILSIINILAYCTHLIYIYIKTWKRTTLVFNKLTPRLCFFLRINPIAAMTWWLLWLIPIWMGFRMYLGDGGLVWNRTEKRNANEKLFRHF